MVENHTKNFFLVTALGKKYLPSICFLLALETLMYKPSLKGENKSSDSSFLIPFCFDSAVCEVWSGTLTAVMVGTMLVEAGCASVGTGFGVGLVFEVTGFELLLFPKLLTCR